MFKRILCVLGILACLVSPVSANQTIQVNHQTVNTIVVCEEGFKFLIATTRDFGGESVSVSVVQVYGGTNGIRPVQPLRCK